MRSIPLPSETCTGTAGAPGPHDPKKCPVGGSFLTVFQGDSLVVQCAAELFLSFSYFRSLEPIPNPGFRQYVFGMR